MLIAVEGIDGSGKTTIGKEIANRLKFDFVEKALHDALDLPVCDYIHLRENLKKNTIASKQIMAMFFGMNNIICGTMGKSKNIVSDRYIATNYYWYGCNETENIYDAIIHSSGKPHLTVLLNASPETITERIKSRSYASMADQDRELSLAPYAIDFLYKTKQFLDCHDFNYIVVDNDNRSVSDVVDEIIAHIPL